MSEQSTKQQIPEGYWLDNQGRLVPEEMVKPIDQLRNELVMELVVKALEVSTMLAEFKAMAFDRIDTFVNLSAQEYGREWGGEKGNICLLSYDGRFKLLKAVSESYVFDERLQVAKELIDECIKDWAAGSVPEIKALINDAFQVDKQGNVNAKRILSLRKFDIEDERWQRAMSAISDSLTASGSRSYLRLYERIGTTDRWRQVPLDLSAV